MDPTEVQSIDQGVFAFPKPTFKHGLGYVFSISAMLVAFGLFSSSLVIPDVPREEANVLPYLHDDMAAYEYGSLQDGYDSDEYAAQAAFVVVPLNSLRERWPTTIANGWKTTKAGGIGITISPWQTPNRSP